MKRGPKPSRRYDVRDLCNSIGSARQVGEAIGTSRVNVAMIIGRGATTFQADAIATAAGLHPLEVWPDFYEDVA